MSATPFAKTAGAGTALPPTKKALLLSFDRESKAAHAHAFKPRTTHPKGFISTIGVDFAVLSSGSNKLQIWDMAGQSKFKAISASFFNNSDFICIPTRAADAGQLAETVRELISNRENIPCNTVLLLNLDFPPTASLTAQEVDITALRGAGFDVQQLTINNANKLNELIDFAHGVTATVAPTATAPEGGGAGSAPSA